MDRPSPVPTSPDAKWVLVHVTGSNTLDAPPKGSLHRKDVVAARKRAPDRRQDSQRSQTVLTLALSALPAITPDVHLCRSSLIPTTIQRVAVCGGSGAFLTKTAINRKADIYITGDYKYHDFFNAENKIIIADIGHYESEQYTKEIFYELIIKKISNFAVQFSKVCTNPVHYL